MKIREIIEKVNNPKLYEKGTHLMWEDPHISKYLLQTHLDPTVEKASRLPKNIDMTIDLIDTIAKPNSKILDLGCGPGIYTEKLASKGHIVTGVDISKNSIDYANIQSQKNNSNINYIVSDYTKLNLEETFDIIMIIYCDFGVLVPDDRNALMQKVYNHLNPGGIFIFDAYNEKIHLSEPTWEASENGFWQMTPYISLNNNYHFKDEKAILSQHIIIDEKDDYKVYRFHNHYFNKYDVENMFFKFGFSNVEEKINVLKEQNFDNFEDISFYFVAK